MLTFPSQVFQLWIAPPAWGKTRLIRELVQSCESEFLFISPLRALAIEVKNQCPVLNTVLPEEILNYDWQALATTKPHLIVIWDEIHLMKEWGESFRPAYLEAWFGFCDSGLRGIGMTATLSENVKSFLVDTLSQNYEFILMGDAGNFSFQNKEIKYFLGSLQWRQELIEDYFDQTIVFCSHRFEVNLWVSRLKQLGIDAWGCLGGETKFFQERLQKEAPPQIIFATSCLSHGVNLPNLKRVILLDDSAPWWMIHQMQTRAGRRGGSFEVWGSLMHPNLSLVERIGAFLRLLLRVMIFRLKSSLRAWLYGVRGISHSGHSAERA